MNTVKNKREYILACSIGDGYIYLNETSKNAALKITHSEKQLDYLKWKTKLLSDNTDLTTTFKIYTSKNKYGFKSYTSTFNNYKKLRIYKKWLYCDNKKTIKNILKYLNSPMSLGIWFMDDGSIMKRKRKHLDGTTYYLRPSSELCTHSFGYEDQILILNWLKDTFDITGYVVKKFSKKQGKIYYMLNFNAENTKKIYNIIKPYIIKIPSMLIKFSYLFEYYSAEHV
jgi:hypothetical protein